MSDMLNQKGISKSSIFFDKFSFLCKKKGVSFSKAVESIGLNRTVVVKWKNGSIPSGSTLTKLATYFDVPVDYLLDKKDDSTEVLPSAASLSSSQKQLVELAESLTDDEIKKVLSYIRFVLSERDGK